MNHHSTFSTDNTATLEQAVQDSVSRTGRNPATVYSNDILLAIGFPLLGEVVLQSFQWECCIPERIEYQLTRLQIGTNGFCHFTSLSAVCTVVFREGR
ncbi:hypothetical protein PaoP5_106 [Pseudomonas phage PaoP5]|uniref:hypothetical protein n=1 Tax=Pseudomonas phage PaoP5 TaxID=1716042 RepID=UPI0007392040|nr:hypothetical protein PaoP5_106 [Pseudomonas phage PaoP5]ALT58385.1 hypothetical protein PaoP5_106 [Pseudomonas phage PaoP5]